MLWKLGQALYPQREGKRSVQLPVLAPISCAPSSCIWLWCLRPENKRLEQMIPKAPPPNILCFRHLEHLQMLGNTASHGCLIRNSMTAGDGWSSFSVFLMAHPWALKRPFLGNTNTNVQTWMFGTVKYPDQCRGGRKINKSMTQLR